MPVIVVSYKLFWPGDEEMTKIFLNFQKWFWGGIYKTVYELINFLFVKGALSQALETV